MSTVGAPCGALARLRRLLAAPRGAERRLRLALSVARVGTWDWHLDSGEVRWPAEPWDGRAEGFAGTLEEFLAAIHPEDRGPVRQALSGLAVGPREQGTDGTQVGFRLVLADGQVRWRSFTCGVVRGRTGRVVQVTGLTRDVTELKAADARLLEAQERYRTLVEQLPLVSYVERLDEENASYISPQIANLVGYTAEEWVSDPEFFARRLHPEDRDRVLTAFAEMHASGESLDCEYRVIARDGSTVWVHDGAVVVRDESGNPRYAQGYMKDVTARRHAEDELKQSQLLLREQMERAEHLALHDGLTGLPNRRVFQDRIGHELARSERTGAGFAVMLIDLDRFKEVNDTLGHSSGDLLLCNVAERLPAALRSGDTVARLGGDEFGVLTPGVSDPAEARRLAERMRQALMQTMDIGGVHLEVEASIGIALHPEHGDDVETLVKRADMSMYRSKNTHAPTVYASELDDHSLARLALVSELRRALAGDELVVHYQPQATLATGVVNKVEALVRWRHPEHGMLGPDKFIPLAEQSGLIRAVTRHVLDTALAQCRIWQDEGRALRVAVNITGRELVDLGFPDEVAELLTKWQIEPTRLELEITENTIMTDPPRARAILRRLQDLGIRLAIDDFGSGHSSLGYLKRLPVDVLKIDKSFVQNMDGNGVDAAVVRSAIDLGRSMGLEVVAEGVETADARDRLAELGCTTIQGYYLGRPVPGEALFADPTPTADPAPAAAPVAPAAVAGSDAA